MLAGHEVSAEATIELVYRPRCRQSYRWCDYACTIIRGSTVDSGRYDRLQWSATFSFYQRTAFLSATLRCWHGRMACLRRYGSGRPIYSAIVVCSIAQYRASRCYPSKRSQSLRCEARQTHCKAVYNHTTANSTLHCFYPPQCIITSNIWILQAELREAYMKQASAVQSHWTLQWAGSKDVPAQLSSSIGAKCNSRLRKLVPQVDM